MAVTTTATPYCSATRLLDYLDYRIVADCLSDSDSEALPSRLALLDSTSEAGARLAQVLLAASGEVESVCVGTGIYTPTELTSLTGATAALLQRVVAGLALIQLYGRRMPSTGRIEDIPLAKYAMDAMEQLRLGTRIFGLSTAIDASTGPEHVDPVVTPSTDRRTVTAASRYFGTRAPR